MATETANIPTPTDWRRIHALGLPSGSVRALLAMLIFATAGYLLVLRPGQDVPDYLRDLLFIIMGHYFAVRSRSAPEREAGPGPLYLPNGSVRILLVLGVVATAAILYRGGELTAPGRNPGVLTLLLIGGFLALGVALNAVFSWWKDRGHRPSRVIEDLRAIVSMAAAVLLVALVANRVYHVVPQPRIDAMTAGWLHLGRFGPENVLAAVVGFYFGSKS